MGRTNVSGDSTPVISETCATSSERRDARHEVLAEGRGARDDVRVVARERDHQRRDVLGQPACVLRALGVQHLRDARELRRIGRGARGALPGDQHVDIAAHLRGGGDRVGRAAANVRVVVFRNDEDAMIGLDPRRHGMICLVVFTSNHLRFVLQLVDELGDVLHHDARLALAAARRPSASSAAARRRRPARRASRRRAASSSPS